jgi:hypothetical protein
LDLKFESGKFMVIQKCGVDFQSKAVIIDEVSERLSQTTAARSVSRNQQVPEVR